MFQSTSVATGSLEYLEDSSSETRGLTKRNNNRKKLKLTVAVPTYTLQSSLREESLGSVRTKVVIISNDDRTE